MTTTTLLLALLVGGPAAPADDGAKDADHAEDRAALDEVVASFTRAFDRGDAKAVAATFAEDAQVVDEEGKATVGRQAIEALFASSFQAHPGARIALTVESRLFATPEVAVEEGTAEIRPAAGVEAEVTRYTATYVKKDGRWLHATVRDHASDADSPHEHLKDLAWLVGDWVNEGPEALVHSTWSWDEGGNYLLRSFSVQVAGKPLWKGTERVAWDPSMRAFRSWVFDEAGGFVESTWSRDDGGRWVLASRASLRDGRVVEETRTLSRVGKDHLRWQLSGPAEGGLEYDMVRKPPQPR